MPNPDFNARIYRPPTLAEVEADSEPATFAALPEPERHWIRAHGAIGVYGKAALILPSAYCEAIGCEAFTGTHTAFCADHWFCVSEPNKRALKACSRVWKDDPELEQFMFQATLYASVLSIVDEENEDPDYVRVVENYRARHRVVQGELHRALEARKPEPPKKPRLYLETAKPVDSEAKRFFMATLSIREGDLRTHDTPGAFDGVCLSAIPCSPKLLSLAKAEGWDAERLRRRIAERYKASLAKEYLCPGFVDDGVPNGLRGYDANAWYVSRRIDKAVVLEDGDCIVLGELEGFADVDVARVFAPFLIFAGFEVVLRGDPVSYDEIDYYAEMIWRGERL